MIGCAAEQKWTNSCLKTMLKTAPPLISLEIGHDSFPQEHSMKRQLLIMTLAMVAAFAATTPAARAQNGCSNGGGWDCGYGWLYNTLRYEVPHFAAFPPVYYSAPVPRTYGYSPFAYPPNVMTPEIVGEVEPLTINNPYVPATTPAAAPADSKSDSSASADRRVEPLVIINPFVTRRDAVAHNER